MDSSNEFEYSEKIFLQLIQSNQLQQKMVQKLLVLQAYLKNQPIQNNIYDELSDADIEALGKLKKSLQEQMFIEIIRDFAIMNKFTFSSATELIQGEIDVKSKNLGSWKPKKFELNFKRKTFEILRSKKSKKKPRIINLASYQLQIVEAKSSRKQFRLTCIDEKDGYYKKLNCGSSDHNLCQTLIDGLRMIAQWGPEISKKKKDKNKKNKAKTPEKSQSFISEDSEATQHNFRQYQSMVVYRGKIEQQQEVTQKQNKKSKEEKKNEPQVESKQQPEYVSEKEKKLDTGIEKINITEKPIEMREDKKGIEAIQKSQKLAESPVSKQQEQQKTKIIEKTQTSQEIIIQKPPEQFQQQFSPQKLQDQKQIIVEEEEEEDEFHSVEDPTEQREQIFYSENYDLPKIFQNLKDEQKLEENYFQISSKNFTQIFNKDNLIIMKSLQNPLLFRCYLELPKSTNTQRLFQALSEIEFMKKWNGTINSEESRIVSVIQSERSAIIYEKRKQYGLFYLPRDFVYLRHVIQVNNAIYILDKSIEHEEVPQFFRVIRGEINYQLIQIYETNDIIRITLEIESTNGGFSSSDQDGDITLVNLKELFNIGQFLSQYGLSPIIDSPFLSALKFHRKSVHIILEEEKSVQQVEIKEELIDDFFDPSGEIDPSKYERNRRISQAQQADIQRRLSTIQSTSTYKVQEQVTEVNEIKAIEEEQEFYNDAESEVVSQKEFLPEDVVTSTRSNLTEEDRQKVIRQIAKIEANQHFSYCLSHKFQLAPVDIKIPEYIMECEGGHFFLRKDWERDKKNGNLRFINPVKIEAQKRVIKYMLKKIGSNLVSGKSVLSVSLPVDIFETRSNLERTAYSFTYAPRFLEEAAKINDPVLQMKYTMTFGLSSIIMYLSLEKPFNPILGETYQGFINGCPVFVEQISHHPPICAFQMVGRGYVIDGHIETIAQMHANSFTGKNEGYTRVIYQNTKAKQMFISVPGTLQGTAFGDRIFKLEGKQFGIDLENEIFSDVTFNPGKSSLFSKKENPSDYFQGGIYKVKPIAVNRYKREGFCKWSGLDLNKEIIQQYHTITGIWNEYMEVDQQQTWNLSMQPYQLTNHPNPLPSDSNYRTDVLYWKLKDFDNSQRTKEIWEVLQRKDKKNREAVGGKKH